MRIAILAAAVLLVGAGFGAVTLTAAPRSDTEPLRPIEVTAPQQVPAPQGIEPAAPATTPVAPPTVADTQGVPPPPPPAHTNVLPAGPATGSDDGGDWDGDDDAWDDDGDWDDGDWDDGDGD